MLVIIIIKFITPTGSVAKQKSTTTCTNM